MFCASCLWFQDVEAITEGHVTDLQAIRQHRNLIAHQPVRLLVDNAVDVNLELLKKVHHLLSKIDKWEILKIEVLTTSLHPTGGQRANRLPVAGFFTKPLPAEKWLR